MPRIHKIQLRANTIYLEIISMLLNWYVCITSLVLNYGLMLEREHIMAFLYVVGLKCGSKVCFISSTIIMLG